MDDLRFPFRSVHAALSEAAEGRRGKVALIHESGNVTFGGLLEKIDNTVRHLRALGIGQGDTFALYGQNTLEHYYCYYAASKMGAVFVPVNPNLTASELAYAFQHSGARFLLHDEHVAATAKAAIPAEKLLPVEHLRSLAAGDDHQGVEVDPAADFVISYSSGTTGTPKAVVLDQGSQVAVARSAARMWGVTDRDVTLLGLPLGYLYGLSTSSGTVLHAGGTVVVLRRFHPREALEGFVRHGVTLYMGVPTMYSMMLDYCDQKGLSFDLSHMRRLICAGAPLPNEVVARFRSRFGAGIQNYYGLSESFPIFGHYEDDASHAPAGSVGKLAPGATVRIQRPDGSDCATGEAGEAFVRGPCTMKRYDKAPEMTEAAMVDGMFRTGDLVSRDAEGYFYITGRIKEILIHGGHKIAPSEVEHVLAAHPAVQDVAVVGVPDPVYGENPVAFVVLHHGANATQAELTEHAARTLSDFKVPKRVFFETALPLGKTGKVDKRLLKETAERTLVSG
jgi:long-chain acyl-CoA synthetase